MKMHRISRRICQALTGVVFGGTVGMGGFPGCDGDTQTVLVEGLNDATVNFISGVIDAIRPDTGTDGSGNGGGGDSVPSV
jgi:hypothetical protein